MSRGRRVSRRDVLRAAGGVPLLYALPGASGCAGPGGLLRMGPWPARPGQTTMSLWCEGEPRCVSHAELTTLDGNRVARRSFEKLDEGLFLATFDELTADTEYRFIVRDAAHLQHEGSFRTLPTREGKVSLAISSDVHPESAPFRAFGAIVARLPHLYLGLGDQVYADLDPRVPLVQTDLGFQELYTRTWSDSDLQTCFSHVASLLVWDDHETRNDFYPEGDPRDLAAATAYQRYQWSRSGSATPYLELDLGPASLFVLDTRAFRSPNGAPDGPDKTMLGAAQLEALLTFIATSTADLCIVASPTPFHPFADTGLDAWAQGYAHERAIVMSAIEQRGADRFVLVTGDQHWPAVVWNTLPGGGRVLELQCTPLAAFPRTPPSDPPADFLYVGDGSPGFGLLDIDGSTGSVVFSWVSADDETRFTRVLR